MSGYYPLYVGAAYPASGGGGSGDMILASVQTVTGAKTFNDSTLLLANVAGTFSSKFTNTNTGARTYTLPDATGTVALISDLSSYATSTHVHGNITNAGAIGATANLPLITTTSGVVTVGTFGTSANSFCQGNDSRLSDARTPVAHSTDLLTSGTLPVARGGTGLTALGTSLQVLRTNAGATALEYATITAGIGGSTGATDNRILRSDGTGGATLQNSAVTIDDSGNVTGVATLDASGTITILANNPLFASTSNLSTGASGFIATNNAAVTCQFGVWGSARAAFGGIAQSNAFVYGDNPFAITSLTTIKFCSGTGIPERMRLHSTGGLSYGNTTDPGAGVVSITGAVITSGAVTIGGGTAIAKVLSATATLDFPSIASNDTHSLTMTVTGAVAGNAVFIGVPAALDANLIWQASVTAADTVTIRMHNASGSSVDPASGTYRATVFQF